MALRRIRTFRVPGDPTLANELAGQLAKFEENVLQETDDIRTGYQQRVRPVAFDKRTSDVQIAPGQGAGFDTSAGNVSVTLTRPSAKDEGKFTTVWKIFAANTLTVLVPAGVTINRATSLARAAVGLQLIYCDGREYWA